MVCECSIRVYQCCFAETAQLINVELVGFTSNCLSYDTVYNCVGMYELSILNESTKNTGVSVVCQLSII